MFISLGIDTGGTYTDAVLLEQTSGEIQGTAKALTTRDDLSIGIERAIVSVIEEAKSRSKPVRPADIHMVGLSTTLATNAIAEGYGARVCLLLVGYDQNLMIKWGFCRENEITPLDIDGAYQAILARRDDVKTFAISGYFSTRDATHELELRRSMGDLTGLPVTCGGELTTRFNAVRRAATGALNARLIPLLRDLITKVRSV